MARIAGGRRFSMVPSLLVPLSLFLTLFIVAAFGYTLITGGMPGLGPGRGWVARPAAELGKAAGFWQRHVNAADGYVLALPAEWQVVPLDGATAAAGEAAVQERLAALARQYREAGMGLWVAEAPGGTLGNATTVNIVRQPLGQDVPVDEFAEASLASLAESMQLTGEIRKRSVDLPAGRALMTEMVYQATGADGQAKTLTMTQVYLVRGQDGYVVTCTARPEEATSYAPIVEGMVSSLRWLDTALGIKPAEPPWALLQSTPRAVWS